MNEKITGIKCVWLDLDDTLWDFRANSRELLGLLYHERGFSRWFASEQEWVERYEEHNHRLWRDYAAARISREFLRADRFRRPLLDAGCPAPVAEAEGEFLDVHYLERLGLMSRLLPGAEELLGYLRGRGYQIGVLSNGFTEVQHSKLRVSGLEQLVDMVVLSDDIGVTKPDRRIFDYAESRCGATAEQCVMVGDNPDTDIAGALGAGWRAIYLRREGAPGGPAEAAEVTELHQIRYFL